MILRGLKWITKWALVVFILWCFIGAYMLFNQRNIEPRGELIDIGGRNMRIVCDGTRAPNSPLIVFEAGAYSGSPDWGYIQPKVAEFARTCSYDRAGMGWSDTSEQVRSVQNISTDLKVLLEAANEDGPYLVVGHSMAGLMLRGFIAQETDNVVGAVFIDAASPEFIDDPRVDKWIKRYSRIANISAFLSKLGAIKPFTPLLSNKIGLPKSQALDEKNALFGRPKHQKAAAREIAEISRSRDSIRALMQQADQYLTTIPVTTITTGSSQGVRHAVADRSVSGQKFGLAGANHTTLLGPNFAQTTIDQIKRIYDEVMN